MKTIDTYFFIIVLSIAYETLNNPSSKLVYDLSKQKGTFRVSSDDETNSNDTLQRVLHQVHTHTLYAITY
jgi:hypothetical protein